MKPFLFLLPLFLFLLDSLECISCSVLYYIDENTGKIYVANHEDYWYDTKAYIQIERRSDDELARLWYGWDDFAQGGVNEAGLFFDGAVTPEVNIPQGYDKPKGNLGDRILANCSTVQEAVDFLEKEKVALKSGHMMFGDSTGYAVVIEWVDGEKKVVPISGNKLLMTNYLLSDTTKGNYPCHRYASIEKSIENLEKKESINLLKVGNTLAPAAQTPREIESGKTGGTLYSTFINISDMEFVLIYQLDNSKVTKLDLKEVFGHEKRQKIKLR